MPVKSLTDPKNENGGSTLDLTGIDFSQLTDLDYIALGFADLYNRVKRLEKQTNIVPVNDAYDPRVPPAENVQLISASTVGAQTKVAVSWVKPADSEIQGFDIWIKRATYQSDAPQKVTSVPDSPATFTLPVDQTTSVVVYIQTVMKSGLRNELSLCPTVTFNANVFSPPSLSANASGTLVLTAAWQDVPGMTFSLSKKGTWLIIASCSFSCATADSGLTAQLIFGGITVTGQILVDGFGLAASPYMMGTRTWLCLSTTGSEVVKIQGKKTAGAGGSAIQSTNSVLCAVWVSD